MKRYFLYDPKAKKYYRCFFLSKESAEKARTDSIKFAKRSYEGWKNSPFKGRERKAKHEVEYWNRVVIREFDMKCVAEY